MGPTRKADEINSDTDNRKLARFFARRVKRYSELQTFPRHWDGWLTRAFVTAMESASA
jgi:hypothetical protein